MSTVGVDVGGTFTDFVVLDDATGSISVHKRPSTPDDPSRAILEGLEELSGSTLDPAAISSFLHGTTITTNALIERRGARVGLLLTGKMRGVYQVQSQMKVGPYYSMTRQRQPSLVDERDVFEVPERVDGRGDVVRELDEEAVRAVGAAVRARGLESVAICFLFSYAHPEHERRAKEILLDEAPACHVSCSADILPRVREWPRMSTTILDAFLEPVLAAYLATLARGLVTKGVRTERAFVMASNGGVMPFRALDAGGKAVHTVLSGPAAAVQAAKRLAELHGSENLITMDLGGTSCDIAFVQHGEALEVTGGDVCGYELFVPMLDIATIGAGGGTIARLDADGRLQVGPDSAGADPGPASYGRGGEEATITDADLVLGYLDAAHFLGGQLPLDATLARAAIERRVAAGLGVAVEDAALAMVRVNDSHMTDAIRVVAARSGVNLAECRLVACGGAGPVHAIAVATELGIREILVPESPGVFAALGLLCTDVAQDFVQTRISRLDETTDAAVRDGFRALERRAKDDLARQGIAAHEVGFVREVDARYAGQGFEIRVPVPPLSGPSLGAEVGTRFHGRHREVYGHASEDDPVEIVNYRVRAVVAMPQYRPKEQRAKAVAPVGDRSRRVRFATGEVTARVLARAVLAKGDTVEGPAIVEQDDTTTVIAPGWSGAVDEFGTLVLRATAR